MGTHRILLVIGIAGTIASSGCQDVSRFDCGDDGICDAIQQAHQIDRFAIQGRQGHTFEAADEIYHLVHFEYGRANDCPSGCFYSHYCAVITGGVEYPAYFFSVWHDEFLFNPREYCPDFNFSLMSSPDFDCDMPAWSLPLLKDPGFRDWVLNPDDPGDELRWCRNIFRRGYQEGHW